MFISRSSVVLLAIASLIALNCSACSPNRSEGRPTPAPSPQPTPSPSLPTTQTPVQDDSYRLALDRADSAKSISQSAQSPEDWQLVVARWRQAVSLLKQVPKTDPNRKLAAQKLADYQRRLTIAQKRAARIGKENVATIDSGIRVDAPVASSEVIMSDSQSNHRYRVRIKYRKSRIPVIDVVFNGKQRFEMMVDTGASGTMITEKMAQTLGVKVVGSNRAMTAAGPATVEVGFVKSISVGGSTIRDVPVSIGPLDVGLLGHDFFGDCDISIKRDFVEFAQCNM